jgi:uncharacterized protein (TIGR02594 family)
VKQGAWTASLAILLMLLASAAEARGRLAYLREKSARGGATDRAADLVGIAERYIGSRNPTGATGPWCADFISFVFRRAGRRPLSNRMAASALAYGPRERHARRGDLVVVRTRRGPYGHVGLVVADLGDWIEIVSGNWGDRVARARLPRSRVAAFVRVGDV